MYCIVPLAGPDFYNEDYGIKPNYEVDGERLVKKAIKSRWWYKNGELINKNIIFILRDEEIYKDFEVYLKNEFQGCKIVKISDFTKGALMSSLAGASLISDFNVPIVVDLIDIIYETEFSPMKLFKEDRGLGGIIPYFKSNNPKYSYLEIVDDYVKQCTEKIVISDNASAGTYFFRNLNIFLQLISKSVRLNKIISYKENLFVCPCYNLLDDSMFIRGIKIAVSHELSLFFHHEKE